MKKKLLIVTGAGGSVEFGMPKVSEIDQLFHNWAEALMPLVTQAGNLYSVIRDRINTIYQGKHLPRSTNFEEVLYQLSLLSEVQNGNHALRGLVTPDPLPDINAFGRTIRAPDGNDLSFLQSYLIDHLLGDIRKRCLSLATTKQQELKFYKQFMDDLRNEFEIGIITVNYDDTALRCCPGAETGFDQNGVFEPKIVFNRNWNFHYHLHGSVHFDMQTGQRDSMHEIKWVDNLTHKFSQNSSGRSTDRTMEGLGILKSSIIAGYDKSDQILRHPYSTYYSETERIIQEADAYLICGYGFGDYHLNHQLSQIRSSAGSSKKIVIVDWAADNEDCLQFGYNARDWAWNLTKTIPIDISSMGSKKYTSAPDIGDLKKDKDFEYSHNSQFPLAIWYDGFLSACQHSSKIVSQLL